MPRSPNRRYLEIPTPLYEQIAELARRDGLTVAQLAADLLVDGLSMREYYGQLAGDVHELRRDVQRLVEGLLAEE